MNTPLVLIVFNRPALTAQLMEIVGRVKPQELFVISDGPRIDGNSHEKETVAATRNLLNHLTWNCEVKTKYSTENLGCRKSVSDGLDWVFEHTDRAIILEDDCMPDLTFFTFCEEMLNKYNNSASVAMISGNNFFEKPMKYSYGFCRHSLIWGWATWKHAWASYRKAEKQGLIELSSNYGSYSKKMSPRRINAIKKTLKGKIDTWDYIWQMAMLMNNSLCAYPSTNLVRNIGFGSGATHTKRKTFHSDLHNRSMQFPLLHPPVIEEDRAFDNLMEKSYQPLSILIDVVRHLFR